MIIYNITDDGVKYEKERSQLLFSSYYFLSNLRIESSRDLYDIVDLTIELGGIKSALFTVIGAIGNYINI